METLNEKVAGLKWPAAEMTDKELLEVVEQDSMHTCENLLRAARSRARVLKALHEWEHGALFLSSTTRLYEHPAYKAIVAEGWEAVPVLIERMAWKPTWLGSALTAITGIKAEISERDAGRLDALAAWWVTWAIAQGLWR